MLDHRLARLDTRADISVHARGARPHLHVPGEILVARSDLPRIRHALDQLGANDLPGSDRLGVARLAIGVPVEVALRRLRGAVDPPPTVAPHHVFVGAPKWAGGPATLPLPARNRTTLPAHGPGTGTRIVVIDTGYTPKLHPDLDTHVGDEPATAEATDVDPADGWLDDEAGHGTFIAGIIAAAAPGAVIDLVHVLDSEGFGTELAIAHAIVQHARHDILNLSLGGYTERDQPPLLIAEALRHVAFGAVITAAAGNDCSSRPFWPAAFKRVIAVGATRGGSPPEPAAFTNYGPWVDCCAPGVDIVSTFLTYDETTRELSPPTMPGRTPHDFRGWAVWSGTSFAAPYVAGAVAARRSEHGFATASEAVADLFGTAAATLAGLGVVIV
jgi:subtilisin family serine protease